VFRTGVTGQVFRTGVQETSVPRLQSFFSSSVVLLVFFIIVVIIARVSAPPAADVEDGANEGERDADEDVAENRKLREHPLEGERTNSLGETGSRREDR